MGKSHNIKTYSDDYTAEYGKYAADVKNVKRGNKKRIAKHDKSLFAETSNVRKKRKAGYSFHGR